MDELQKKTFEQFFYLVSNCHLEKTDHQNEVGWKIGVGFVTFTKSTRRISDTYNFMSFQKTLALKGHGSV